MGIARARARHLLALGMVLAGILLAACPCVFALDPKLGISQYAHTSWRNREGFSQGAIFSIAQTPDGYLWLGTESGLLRFDGVRAVPWQLPSGQHLPSNSVPALLPTRDGTLFIGTIEGLASWKAGELTQYPQLAGLLVNALAEDHEGTVWAGGFAYTPPGKLCAIQSGTVHCFGEDGTLGNGVLGLYEDGKGSLWAGVLNGFWLWKPGASQFFALAGEPNGIQNFAEDRDGTLLIPVGGRVAGLTNGKIKTAYPYPVAQRQVHGEHILRDRDGGVWVGTLNQGLVHVHEGGTDRFAQPDGLSGDLVTAILEDREGSIWVSTTKGLDRFSAYSVSTFSERQGMSSGPDASVAAARDESIWFSARSRLGRWNKGQVTIYREPGTRTESIPAAVEGRVREVTVNGLPPHDLASLFQDDDGRIWVAANGGVGYFQNDHFVPVNDTPGGVVYAMAGDRKGNLWISNFDRGLLHLFRGRLIQQIPWAALGRKDLVTALAADRSQGGVWLGFSKGGIEYLRDGQIGVSYTAAAGLGEGRVSDIQFDHDGALWVATNGGLSRLKDGRIARLTMKQGLPCDKLFWLAEDSDLSLWLFGSCGLVRIARSELEAWAADTKGHPRHVVKTTLLDRSDGITIKEDLSSSPGPRASKAPDGRIWFPVIDGVSVFDPSRLHFNELPPPVHIEQIIADRKTYRPDPDSNARVRLPSLVRDLQIDYTALSFVAPEKVLFRYKLEGWDRDWWDAGTRRQAFYNNLPPRNYNFRVKACNNSGVWSEAGASMDFSVEPAYYQTWWFRVGCVAALAALLSAFYYLRLQGLQRQFDIGLDARVAERMRIARELHDTLLQNVQGLILKIDAVAKTIPKEAAARQAIEKTLDYADQVIAEGRERVRTLRSGYIQYGQLPKAFQRVADEAAPNRTSTFKTVVEGSVLELNPIVREESYSIGREAIINALTHSEGSNIEVEIAYDPRQFRLCIRDDGRGIDPAFLEKGGREDHWGLQGMRERASKIGGQLEVWSRPRAGTEVALMIPGHTAYQDAGARQNLWTRWFSSSNGDQA